MHLITTVVLSKELAGMILVCQRCVNYKKGIRHQIPQKDCLEACVLHSECLGALVGRGDKYNKPECVLITKLPDDAWDTPDSHYLYDTWKKGKIIRLLNQFTKHYVISGLTSNTRSLIIIIEI